MTVLSPTGRWELRGGGAAAAGALAAAGCLGREGGDSRRREFWHFADTPSPSLLKQLNDGLADGQAGILVPGSGLGRLAMELAASGCGLTIQLTGTATTPIPASFIRRRRDCHFADIPSPTFVSIGMERECHQNDIIADGYHSHAESRNLDSAINIQLPC